MADGNSFVAVVNDTTTKLTRTTKNGKEKTYSPSFKTVISGNNHAQLLGKKIGDVIDGIFVGEGESTLTGYKLEITGGSDKTGTPMRRDLDGGSRQAILVTASTGFKGHSLVSKTKNGPRLRRAKAVDQVESQPTPGPRAPVVLQADTRHRSTQRPTRAALARRGTQRAIHSQPVKSVPSADTKTRTRQTRTRARSAISGGLPIKPGRVRAVFPAPREST